MGDLNSKRGRIQGSSVDRQRRGRDRRARADVGGAALRDRPALDDRRARPLHDHATRTTTRCPSHLADKVAAAKASRVANVSSRLAPARVEAVLRPVLGVRLGVLAEDRAVDGVELDEAAQRRWRVGAVEQDAPRRARAQAAPAELRRRVADREPDRPARDRERLGLVDLERATRRGSGTRRSSTSSTPATTSPALLAREPTGERTAPASTRWMRPGDAAATDVGEEVRARRTR